MRIAPGSFVVLCSNGYFSRTSSNTGRAAGSTCSSLVFRSSRVMRGTGTAAILAVSHDRFQVPWLMTGRGLGLGLLDLRPKTPDPSQGSSRLYGRATELLPTITR